MRTHAVSTAMRQAFIEGAITRSTSAALVNKVAHSVLAENGVYKVRDWNASLSFQTAQKLGAPAFEGNMRIRTRFDSMCQTPAGDE